jgi:hypothetical protein
MIVTASRDIILYRTKELSSTCFQFSFIYHLIRAAPYLKRLVAGFPPRRPGFKPGSTHVGFVVDKLAVGQVSSEYFGFPCQSSFHNHHHLSIIWGWYNRLVVAAVPRDSVSPH